ncbi:hypothetical protein [Edaphobacter acidisoli]|uniref:hypothetical protein n=1 Tax=Edaphobacter acidisoli TaxID=2040573 RepID=UPI00166B7B5B|nr:hypothetical protein [Edaphobacter acidisoli]
MKTLAVATTLPSGNPDAATPSEAILSAMEVVFNNRNDCQLAENGSAHASSSESVVHLAEAACFIQVKFPQNIENCI